MALPKQVGKTSRKKGASRLARTLRSLVYIVSLGAILAVYNAVSLRRDISEAVGPKSESQRQFFRNAADRPDITSFFKNLTEPRRLKMATNICFYDDPELASLCGKLLDTFDTSARVQLTKSLSKVAKAHPSEVADQFKLPGSFQQIAISSALRQVGPSVLPLVAKQLKVGDARPNAVAYLVSSGNDAIQPTLPFINEKDKDTRLAAVDALGKLRAEIAVPQILKLYQNSSTDERLAYFTALASIGSPSTESLMVDVITDASASPALRSQAAIGLGQIGSPSALETVWKFCVSPDQGLRSSAISALQLAGDHALRLGESKAAESSTPTVLLQIAGGIHTPLADQLIEKGIKEPATSPLAASVAANRPHLAPVLVTRMRMLNPDDNGELIDALLKALATTDVGRSELTQLAQSPQDSSLSALAERRLRLSRH